MQHWSYQIGTSCIRVSPCVFQLRCHKLAAGLQMLLTLRVPGKQREV